MEIDVQMVDKIELCHKLYYKLFTYAKRKNLGFTHVISDYKGVNREVKEKIDG